MVWFKLIIGLAILIELVIVFVNSHTAPDFTYYMCRPFGIPFPMWLGLLIRFILVALGGICLYSSIGDIIQMF
jgi:hypothetical protein